MTFEYLSEILSLANNSINTSFDILGKIILICEKYLTYCISKT